MTKNRNYFTKRLNQLMNESYKLSQRTVDENVSNTPDINVYDEMISDLHIEAASYGINLEHHSKAFKMDANSKALHENNRFSKIK